MGQVCVPQVYWEGEADILQTHEDGFGSLVLNPFSHSRATRAHDSSVKIQYETDSFH